MTPLVEQSPRVSIVQQTENYRPWDISEQDYPLEGNKHDQFQALLHWAVLAPSSHNTQPWGFKVEDDSIVVLPDFQRSLPESDPTGRELYISLGASVANLVVTAKRFGWSPKVTYGFEGNKYHARVTLEPGYVPTDEDVAMFNAIPKRVNYDGNHKSTPLSLEVITLLQNIFTGQNDINLVLVHDYPTKEKIADLVKQGDSLIFNNPRFVQELVRWLRDAATTRGDGVLTSSLGLPRALRRYAQRLMLNLKQGMIANMVDGDRDKVKKSAAIGVISSTDDSPLAWLKAGELYEFASLAAANAGIYFGARAVLVETGDLHESLERVVSAKGRAQVMFRAGYPAATDLKHAPRIRAPERMVTKIEDDWKVPPNNRPTIFRLDSDYSLNKLLSGLGDVEVESVAFAEHWLPDLFSVHHPDLDVTSLEYLEQLDEFVRLHNTETEGVWVYYPHGRRLVHIPSEDDFYAIITRNNEPEISIDAQKRLKDMHFGIAGLSGSGTEAAMAIVMSGAKYLRIGDFDFLSGRNLGRMRGPIGENKTYILALNLWNHNPFLELTLYPEGITNDNVHDFVNGLDVAIEQTDTIFKFSIRNAATCPVLMVTDLKNPVVDIDIPDRPPFGGRAKKAGITIETMEKIQSAAESTAYIAVLIGPEKLSLGNLKNFLDIVEGSADAYSQTAMAVMSGGGAVGRVVVSIAEGNLESLVNARSWIVDTNPPLQEDPQERRRALQNFLDAYEKRFGSSSVVLYLREYINSI